MNNRMLKVLGAVKDGVVTITDPNVPNHTVSACAATAFSLVLLTNKLLGCDAATYLASLELLSAAGLTVHQYGWRNSVNLLSQGALTMFSQAKSLVTTSTPAPLLEDPEEMRNTKKLQ